ncbi:MAG: hypothetical protein HFH41_12350 [Lachnospiraceae bacterium]|nr:hypothetical protein [Lachnospiraceae bacterium]
MNKRIAYIGLSYPLLYDYQNQAKRSGNDLSDSPNPIIESPLGLMILYDELWFLCKSLCPSNMRKLPYVRYVDEMFPNLYYEGVDAFKESIDLSVKQQSGLSYENILDRMNLKKRRGIDTHTHEIRIGNVAVYGNGGIDNLLFDLYVFMALKEQSTADIELIANSRFCMNEFVQSNYDLGVVEKIVIPDIPNYLSKEGPYHPCMEELRENTYLTDFRKWVTEHHNHIQNSEVDEICRDVNKTIKDTEEKILNKYLKDHNKYAFFRSSGTTIIKTAFGIASIPFSIADAFFGIAIAGKNAHRVSNDRWQGFVVQSRNMIGFN